MSGATAYVTDTVWARLDPHAGRLSRRRARLVWIVALLGVCVLMSTLATVGAGLFVPRVFVNFSGPDLPVVRAGRRVTLAVRLDNEGRLAVTVIALGSPDPALMPLSGGGSPMRIEPHAHVDVRLTYTIGDCATVPHGRIAFPVTYRRWWGIQHAVVTMSEWWPRDLTRSAGAMCGAPG